MNRFSLLLLNVLSDHFVCQISCAHSKVASRPQMAPPKLSPQMRKLLKEYPRTDSLSAIGRSGSHPREVYRPPARECGRLPPSPTESRSYAPSRSVESGRAHEAPPLRSAPSSDISESIQDVPSNRASCARPLGTVSRDHITRPCTSPARRGVSTIPDGDTNLFIANI